MHLELFPRYTLVYPVPIFLVSGLGGELDHTWSCLDVTHYGAEESGQKWNGYTLTPVLSGPMIGCEDLHSTTNQLVNHRSQGANSGCFQISSLKSLPQKK